MGIGTYTGAFEEDESLLSEFRKICTEIDFIGSKFSKKFWPRKKTDLTMNLIDSLKDDKPLTAQSHDLVKLWKQLVSDAIVYLKYNDKREEKWHDSFAFGVDSLTSFFDTFGSFEQYMSSMTKSRDHIAHVMRVYMLGAIALKKMDIGFVDCGEIKGIDEKSKKKITKVGLEISDSEKEAIWCIIALCHDLGLVMENVFNVNYEARKMFEELGRISIKELEFGLSPMFQHMCYNTLKLISSNLHEVQPACVNHDKELKESEINDDDVRYNVHTQYKYYQKFLNALDSYDHGILSCIILIKNLVYFLETDFLLDNVKPFDQVDSRQFLVRKSILEAIASHNCDSIYHLSVMKFPFLLILFDEMQEWDRPRPYMRQQHQLLDTKLVINTINGELVDFTMTFSGGDRRTCHQEVYQYAKRKYTRFTKLLRSAVVGKGERFKFHFEICDQTDGKTWTYKLKHDSPSPKDISIEFPTKDDDWFNMARDHFKGDFNSDEISKSKTKRKKIDWFHWLT